MIMRCQNIDISTGFNVMFMGFHLKQPNLLTWLPCLHILNYCLNIPYRTAKLKLVFRITKYKFPVDIFPNLSCAVIDE